jgi:hypothetical protein
MGTYGNDADDEFDGIDDDERKTKVRRQFMYSVQAIAIASRVEKIFVSHPEFATCLQACDRVFQLSKELEQPQIVLAAGPPGVGKSALIKYFRASLPSGTLFEPGYGAIAVRLPDKPNAGHLLGSVLRQVRHPFPQVTSNTLFIKQEVAIDAMRSKGTRMIFVDEGLKLKNQVRMRSRQATGTSVSSLLCELVDEAGVGICILGDEELLDIESIDSHLASRVSARFKLNNFKNGALWMKFVEAFAKRSSAFDLSVLNAEAKSDRLFAATSGNPRKFKRLVTEGVLIAVDEHASALTDQHLKLGFKRITGDAPQASSPYDGDSQAEA